MDNAKVGAAIRQLRLRDGYTQHELADCLNVTDKAVSKWERGLSMPDVSIVTKLANLLNCDVDNLLEGNISFLETAWQGFLILKESPCVFSGSEVYGKPLVYLLLSYFLLAGIGHIWISCPERDKACIRSLLGDGSGYGIRLEFLPPDTAAPPNPANTMVVFHNPFVYGPNLTKYFQRAMSVQNGISVLILEKHIEKNDMVLSVDRHKVLQMKTSSGELKEYCVPIVFFPVKYFDQIGNAEHMTKLHPLCVEPMGNGMIEYSVQDQDTLLDTAAFLRFLKKHTGKDVYSLQEIARKRNFI